MILTHAMVSDRLFDYFDNVLIDNTTLPVLVLMLFMVIIMLKR